MSCSSASTGYLSDETDIGSDLPVFASSVNSNCSQSLNDVSLNGADKFTSNNSNINSSGNFMVRNANGRPCSWHYGSIASYKTQATDSGNNQNINCDNSSNTHHHHSYAAYTEQVNYFNVEGSGMRDVHSWLKSLRLHKYSDLFSTMTYEAMMSLTEEELELKGVTKGARHKIILNINKLKNRVDNLKALEQSLDEEGYAFIRQALNELKNILATPIKPYSNTTSTSDGNNNSVHPANKSVLRFKNLKMDKYSSSISQVQLPSMFSNGYNTDNVHDDIDDNDLSGHLTRVLTKIFNLILVVNHSDEECLRMFSACADKCLSHEAFTVAQKQKICKYKQQVVALRCPYCGGRRPIRARQPNISSHHYSSSFQNVYTRPTPAPARHHIVTSGQSMSNVLAGKETELINDYIESLCIRMAEQAIGGGIG